MSNGITQQYNSSSYINLDDNKSYTSNVPATSIPLQATPGYISQRLPEQPIAYLPVNNGQRLVTHLPSAAFKFYKTAVYPTGEAYLETITPSVQVMAAVPNIVASVAIYYTSLPISEASDLFTLEKLRSKIFNQHDIAVEIDSIAAIIKSRGLTEDTIRDQTEFNMLNFYKEKMTSFCKKKSYRDQDDGHDLLMDLRYEGIYFRKSSVGLLEKFIMDLASSTAQSEADKDIIDLSDLINDNKSALSVAQNYSATLRDTKDVSVAVTSGQSVSSGNQNAQARPSALSRGALPSHASSHREYDGEVEGEGSRAASSQNAVPSQSNGKKRKAAAKPDKDSEPESRKKPRIKKNQAKKIT